MKTRPLALALAPLAALLATEARAFHEIELDVAKRTSMLHRIQQILHERSVYAPIWQLAFLNGVGKRVGESGLGLIKGHAYSAPYEDVTIKKG